MTDHRRPAPYDLVMLDEHDRGIVHPQVGGGVVTWVIHKCERHHPHGSELHRCGCGAEWDPAVRLAKEVQAKDADELRRWREKCDEVGVPHDPDMLVRHHRANAALAARLLAEAVRLAQEVQP